MNTNLTYPRPLVLRLARLEDKIELAGSKITKTNPWGVIETLVNNYVLDLVQKANLPSQLVDTVEDLTDSEVHARCWVILEQERRTRSEAKQQEQDEEQQEEQQLLLLQQSAPKEPKRILKIMVQLPVVEMDSDSNLIDDGDDDTKNANREMNGGSVTGGMLLDMAAEVSTSTCVAGVKAQALMEDLFSKDRDSLIVHADWSLHKGYRSSVLPVREREGHDDALSVSMDESFGKPPARSSKWQGQLLKFNYSNFDMPVHHSKAARAATARETLLNIYGFSFSSKDAPRSYGVSQSRMPLETERSTGVRNISRSAHTKPDIQKAFEGPRARWVRAVPLVSAPPQVACDMPLPIPMTSTKRLWPQKNKHLPRRPPSISNVIYHPQQEPC